MENFGLIKNKFNSILVEGISTKNDKYKKLFKKYIKTIKESEILKTQFFVYDNIEKNNDKNTLSANISVLENIRLMDKFNKNDILKENKKLIDLYENLDYKGDTSCDEKLVSLYESISFLILNKKNHKTVNEISNIVNNIATFITENKVSDINSDDNIDIPNSVLENVLFEKFKTKYSSITESEKELLTLLLNSTDDKKIETYKKYTNECVNIINEKIKISDINTKDKLLNVKDKLISETVIINEDFPKNLYKLINLFESLK